MEFITQKRFLHGDIVSQINGIYEKNHNNVLEPLKIKHELLEAIKNNAYHSNEVFTEILDAFQNKEVYLQFENNMIRVHSIAHYTSGGIVVNKTFNVTDRIFANGEIIFDGNIGIGRLPGHPFASAISSAKTIANEISKMNLKPVNDGEVFEISKKIKGYSQNDLLEYEEMFNNFSNECFNIVISKFYDKSDLFLVKKEIEKSLDIIYNHICSVKLLNLYYRMNLLYEIVKEKWEVK